MMFTVVGEICVNGVFTKKCDTGNAHARIAVLADWYSWKFLDYRSSLKKNAYKIGLIPILIQYARKVLFSGVFYISSIFHDRGMVMDENGRNGWKWHLAQQLAQHVIIQKQQLTYHVINPHIS